MDINNPHDKFFKEVFSEKLNAVEFIRGTFPPELAAKLDLSTLKLENASYIDEELKEYFSDIVYTCLYGEREQVPISLLFDLSQYNNREIKEKVFRRAALWIALWIMKDITREEIVREHLKKYFELGTLYFREESGLAFFEAVIRYILSATGITPDEMRAAAAHVSRKVEEISMTTAEKLREEGIKEGIEKGTLLERQEVLIRQLSRKFGITDEEKKFIKSISDPAVLDRALDEILFTDSKEVVLRALGD